MKRATAMLTILCLACFIGTTSSYAAGVDLTGIGARAQALGGNYRSIANDWSGMYWNPAGLAFSEGLGAGLSMELVIPQATFQVGNSHYGNINGINWPFSAAYRVERPNEDQVFFVPSGGVTYNMGKLAFGLGVWAPFGLGSQWDILRTAANNLGNVPGKPYDTYNTQYPNIEYESNMQIIDIHPTVSYKISDKLSVGAGASIVYSDILIRKPVYIQNPYLYDETLFQQLMEVSEGGSMAMLFNMRRPPFDHLLTQVEMTGDGLGFGGNFGVMFKPTEDLSIGASVSYFMDQELSGTFENVIYFADVPAYDGLAQVYADSVFTKALQAGLITADEYFILENFYSGQVISEGQMDVNTKLPLPAKAGLGVSYTGFNNLLIAADVTFTQWSAWDQIYIEDTAGGVVTSLVQNWENTIKVGVGLEYTAGSAKLRAGFASEPPAAVPSTMDVAIPDINRRNTIALGIELPVGPLALSLNYEKIFISDRTVSSWNYDALTTAQNLAGVYTMNVNNLMLGVDFNF